MFESVSPDRGADALNRAARMFYVVATLTYVGNCLTLILAIAGHRFVGPVRPTLNFLFAGMAVATGRGIDGQKSWAKWAGYGLGVLELWNFPLGTIVGAAVLVFIHRASKAGLFLSAGTSAPPS
ncbi:MAG: hypothetical protein NVSMB68_01770 [Thermoanaerobaculia bacterium]